MKNVFQGLIIASAVVASACSQGVARDAGSTSGAAISDISSMTQRSDGEFNVVCNNGSQEVVSAATLEAGNVCVTATPPSPPSGGGVATSSVTQYLTNGRAIGTDWTGFVTFTVSYFESSTTAIDGYGNSYQITQGETYARLPTPVTFTVTGPTYYEIGLSSFTFEITSITPYSSITGKADVTTNLTPYLSDLEGVTVQFDAQAQFFTNFTNGAACDALDIHGYDGSSVTLTASAPSSAAKVVAPFYVSIAPSCTPARLQVASEANEQEDFDLSVPVITPVTN